MKWVHEVTKANSAEAGYDIVDTVDVGPVLLIVVEHKGGQCKDPCSCPQNIECITNEVSASRPLLRKYLGEEHFFINKNNLKMQIDPSGD